MSEIIKNSSETVKLIPSEDIVATKVAELRDEIDGLIEEFKHVELDFKSINIIDSSGIGVLISTQNKLLKVGGSLKVVNVSKDINSMFKIMRLDKHFDIESIG